ncbi:hypothetical protein MKJ01_05510 [Chryseobacterium sp. SSA4.19]|uniref:hypothetical protein n=1 Tax=Chryseobacterium sp. SSA4.19 TaxID=2919915 RepID=UPI001F4E60BF|nr:hypothetical protein [Chryseobacterium sp. SSA4.19]MCJ8153218.1 hypothetical protein [Chryseobacterium sp. SSA4.19]
MKQRTQIDNATHPNKVKEREKALAVLEKAKEIPRKVVFLPKGASRDFKKI